MRRVVSPWLACLLLGWGATAVANSPAIIDPNTPASWPADPPPDWEDEPARLLELLNQGHSALQGMDLRTAAGRFCSAARHGSVEAQYRLARTLLLQRGDPTALQQGKTMLLLAAQNGHVRANQILEATGWVVREEMWPLCLQELNDPVLAQLPDQPPEVEPVSFDVVQRYLARLNENQRRWALRVQERAPHFGVDPRLALSIMRAESGFNPDAVSPKNALGLMQLIPATAERFGVKDPMDPVQNIEGGLAYLRWLLRRFDHDVAKVAAGYNAGEGAVDRYKGVPPFAETQAYVERILRFYRAPRHRVPPAPAPAPVQRRQRG